MTITLRLLGGVRLEDASGPLAGEPAQRHRLALLAVLMLAADHRLPREKILALLWPEHPPDGARRLLNTSIYVLRRALGTEAILSEGSDLRLDPTCLACDALQFLDAIERGDADAALSLHTGPFMAGFFLDDAQPFDQWQDAERERMAAALLTGLEAWAQAAERASDPSAAIAYWRRLAAHRPEHAGAALGLMRCLEAVGDRAGALRAADAHAEVLRVEFDAAPDPAVQQLAARMRARPTSVAGSHAAAEPAPGAGPASPERRHRLRWAVAGAATVLMAIAVAALTPRRAAEPPAASVAVLPFRNLDPEGGHPFLGEGLAEELLNDLARLPWLRVAARSSAAQLGRSDASVQAIGRRLSVAAVVRGSIRTARDSVRIAVRLVDAGTGYVLWSEQYDRRLDQVLPLQTEIARAVASALRGELAAQVPDSLFGTGTTSVEAYELYLQGRHEWAKRTAAGMRAALGAFQQAIALDPTYAAAYAGLSDTWQLLPDHGTVPARIGLARAKAAALRAVALDRTEAAAYTSLGAVLDDYDHDWTGAEAAYRRAIELNPSYATARQWLGLHLANQGRFEEALDVMEGARQLDPLSSIVNVAAGAVRYFAGDYAGAIAEHQAVLEQDPDFAVAWAILGRIQLVAGQVDSAVASLDRAVDLSAGDPSHRAVQAAALAAAGRRTEARTIADQLLGAEPGAYVPWCELASAYIHLDDVDQALGLLERGRVELDPAFKHIAVEPLFDRIRAHPRFQALLRDANLPLLTGN